LAKTRLTPEQALQRIQRYCVYQDRCHQEVRSKLIEFGVYGDALETIMAELIEEGFLNEERYARSFARGKFRVKHWGRIRIVQELKARHISTYSIKQGLKEIDETEYRSTLQAVMEKKWEALTNEEPYARKSKTAHYVVSRGFESELVWEFINAWIKGTD
jgi:regulatory protein